jgi:hypothetical protein
MMSAMSVIAPASFAVDIVDRDRLGEQAHGDILELRPVDVYEAAGGTAVNEGLGASLDRSVC